LTSGLAILRLLIWVSWNNSLSCRTTTIFILNSVGERVLMSKPSIKIQRTPPRVRNHAQRKRQ
jgi:hypothetical protein